MLYLKQSTASQPILLGPFVDDTDGTTAETGLTIANTDIRLSANGGNMVAKNSGGGTHDENGWYAITLNATDTATVGRLQISSKVAGALAVFMEVQVLEEAIFDALFAASAVGFDSNQRVNVGSWLGTAVTTSSTSAKPEIDVFSISDDTTAANNNELDYDGTGYNKSNSTIGTTTTNTDMVGTNGANTIVPMTASLSQTEHDATQSTLAGLNDIAATDIVSAGAITTLSGAIVNVDLVDVTTTNTDVRGTNNAALASVATEARLAELDAANLPADIAALNNISTSDLATSLTDIQLDHLLHIADASTTTNNSIIAKMVSKSATASFSSFTNTDDSLEAIRDRGDAAWTTGAGGSDRLLMVDTTIATLASQTGFTLTAGSEDNDAYVNCTIVIEDVSTSTQKAIGLISAYVGSTKEVTLKYDPGVFIMATTDKVYILAENSLKSTAQNRQLDVTSTGTAGIDWANVENPSSTVDLSSTDIQLCDTVTTLTGHTAQTADHTASIADIPTVSEFNARTLVAASYFDPTADAVANVTLVGTTTTNTDMVGTDSAALASVLGAAVGASISADIASVQTDTTSLLSRITATLFSGITSVGEWLGLLAGKQTGNATALTEIKATGAGSGSFSETTDSLEALRNRGDSTWTTATGFSTHSAANVWTSGTRTLTAATNITSDASAINVTSGIINTVTTTVTATNVTTVNALSSAAVTDIWSTDTIPEAYAADGSAATPAQLLYMLWADMHEFAIVGTTITAKKLDGSTAAMTHTLDDATSPTSKTRAT